jgi:IS66 C-terminal element
MAATLGGHIIYLFAGSNAGGQRAAANYSLLGSAKLNRLDPELYLQQVLERDRRRPHQQNLGSVAMEPRSRQDMGHT